MEDTWSARAQPASPTALNMNGSILEASSPSTPSRINGNGTEIRTACTSNVGV